MQEHYNYLIVGGGCGGISVASRLRKKAKGHSIAVIEPATNHYYQPLWTLVGAGMCSLSSTERQQKNLIPIGVDWISDKVKSIDPKRQEVKCANGDSFTYDFLVLATGLELRFDLIPGSEHLGQDGICSIYHKPTVERTAEMIQTFKGGHAVFTMPPVPIKCAGAPQKIMYLADDIFRKNGIRQQTNVTFATAGKVIFGVPEFAQPLTKVAARRDITTLMSHRLIKIDYSNHIAQFEKTIEIHNKGAIDTEIYTLDITYDLLHLVPPMTAHALIRESGLGFEAGSQKDWLKVDPYTLQHMDYKNIFGIGDVTGIPNSKTAAAIRKQTPVVVENLLAAINGLAPGARYDGYSACPLITGKGKVILAEFGYDGKLMPSFPLDMTRERKSMWYLKRYFFPQLYWRGMLKGN